jgi:hypothetical protein
MQIYAQKQASVSYNQLVFVWLDQMKATFLNCGNVLRAFSTTSLGENLLNTRGNDLGHSNNEKDWTICSQAPTCANASTWRRFRDYNGMGLRKLATFDENLRDSPSLNRNIRVSNRAARGGLAYSN